VTITSEEVTIGNVRVTFPKAEIVSADEIEQSLGHSEPTSFKFHPLTNPTLEEADIDMTESEDELK